MADTKLNQKFDIVGIEQLTSKFASTATLASAGFTIPANTGDIYCMPSAACHWTANGAATSTFTHAIVANEVFKIPTAKVRTAQIIGDAGAITLSVAYWRGAGRQDATYSAQSFPR